MKVSNYTYTIGDTKYADRIGIASLNRQDYMTPQYIEMHYDWLTGLKLEGRTALLYVGGAGLHNAENRRANEEFHSTVEVMNSGLVIKSLQAYMLHKYAGVLSKNNNITYANVSSNTCASSLYSIYEAEGLLLRDVVDNVVVIAEEKTSNDTIRIFHEHNIPLTVGEGFAAVVLTNETDGLQISQTKWEYEYARNPFSVTQSGYSKVASECDVVKGHKTGTVVNDEAERLVFGDTVGYKDKIGHCQGASGLIELCMTIEDTALAGKVLCVASGLGGYYGSCVLSK